MADNWMLAVFTDFGNCKSQNDYVFGTGSEGIQYNNSLVKGD